MVTMWNYKNRLLNIILVCSTVLVFILVVQFFRNKTDRQIEKTTGLQKKPESFVFFDLGVNTLFNNTVRKKLSDQLGPDQLETWSPITLEMHEPGFLDTYFPELSEMNRQLTDDDSVDIGKHTIKITYRYAVNKNLPFYYVKLVFSDYTQRPLFFRIKMKQEGRYIVDAIIEKYGTPAKINWGDENRFTLFWKKNSDIMTISKVENRIGESEYQIMIYYVENIREMLQKHNELIKERTEEKTETGKSVF